MSTSRRTFLKTTVAGAGAALGGLPSLARGSASAVKSGELQPHVEAPSGKPQHTRGVGIYPGDPEEDFSPLLVAEGSTYRNLALHRPAYHSSSYDYNLTAQLVTDGIKDTRLPDWVATSASFRGPLPKLEREFFLDHNPTSVIELRGTRPYVQVQLGGGESVPEVDRVDVIFVAPLGLKPENLMVRVSASADGREWKEAGSAAGPKPVPVTGYPMGFAQRGQLFTPSIPLSPAVQTRFYRVEFEAANAPPFSFGMEWKIGQVAFFRQNQRVEIGGPYRFTSAWMSAGLGEEWVYVDLGAVCEFDRIVLFWIARAAEGSVQVSDDARDWKDIQPLPGGADLTDDLKLARPVRGRYVRVLMKRPTSPDGYILSELEVYGRGGLVAHPNPAPPARAGGRLDLAGGAWRLQRDSLVNADGEALSKPGFPDNEWIVATVPGTVLSSSLNVEAIPDPNDGEIQ